MYLYMAGYVYSKCFSTKYKNRYHDSVALETGGMKHHGLEKNPAWSFFNFQKHVSVVIQKVQKIKLGFVASNCIIVFPKPNCFETIVFFQN